MGLIRSYSRTHRMLDWSGDPGFGKWFKRATRVPKAIRKFQPGKALAKIIPAALGFIPGVGGLLSLISQRFGVPQAAAAEFLQVMGVPVDAGDWMGDPGPAKKRKAAGSGTKAKAKKKADRRQQPKSTKPSKAKKIAKGIGGAIGAGLEGMSLDPDELMRRAGEYFGKKMKPGALPFQPHDLGVVPGMPRARGIFGGRRRRINPTNVKALRRGIRRLEGFQKLVKSVERAYPRLRRHAGGGSTRTRGHRSGCGCVVCKRRAA